MKKFFALFLFFSLFSAALFADYNSFGIPDSSEIRSQLRETWFEAPLEVVRMNKPEVKANLIGQKFQVRLEETEDYFSILVAPFATIDVEVFSDKGRRKIKQDVYPGDAPGSWILVRDKKTGKPIKIIYYFASDSDVFVQFSPYGNSSVGDFVIYNCYASKGVITGLPFERYYSASFAEVCKWTEKMLPWEYTRIYRDGYHASLQMINVIREHLPEITLEEDACYDEEYRPVYITTGKERPLNESDKKRLTLSGAGFLKWIGDGIVEPLNGVLLKREPLIYETVRYKPTGFQGILSENYDISFSLDWVRNLATAIVSVRSHRTYRFNNSGVDVTIEPFCSEFTSEGIKNLAGFIPNTGYSCKYLKALLYVLAATESESFYFAAIREVDKSRNPEVKVFNNCAAFFPYFDSNGNFKIVVFKDGSEMTFEEFYNLYSKDFVFLTRCACTENFHPFSLLEY